VTEVSGVADASSGVASYPVTITFDADSKKMFVGSSVTADITTTARENVLQVSSAAVTTSNGRSTVEVTKNGTADGPSETRTVTTGLTSGGTTEITSGLTEGEKVVISLQVPGRGSGGSGTLPDLSGVTAPGSTGSGK
jgi:macrolide-specific efflux system membrane fusion protein